MDNDFDPLGPTGEEIDPDATLYVRGVDYLASWREASDAGEELLNALSSAGIHDVRFVATTEAGGASSVRLTCSPEAVRDMATLVRVTAARLGRAS